ncbi:LapA family protein [Frateuria aurantia]
MRFLVILILLVFALAGVVLGALNAATVGIDLGVLQFHAPLGATLLTILAAGWVTGGLTAWLGVRLRRRPRKVADRPVDA